MQNCIRFDQFQPHGKDTAKGVHKFNNILHLSPGGCKPMNHGGCYWTPFTSASFCEPPRRYLDNCWLHRSVWRRPSSGLAPPKLCWPFSYYDAVLQRGFGHCFGDTRYGETSLGINFWDIMCLCVWNIKNMPPLVWKYKLAYAHIYICNFMHCKLFLDGPL